MYLSFHVSGYSEKLCSFWLFLFCFLRQGFEFAMQLVILGLQMYAATAGFLF